MNQDQLKELKDATAKHMGVAPDEIIIAHVMETPKPCDHDWDNDGCNPEYCLKCGISFMRYAFTEMP
ncbi:MAG: hypothetical protein ACXV8O_01295 [Methylobacter sp.]